MICSYFLVLVRILAAAFWMSCSCLTVFFGRPVQVKLLKTPLLMCKQVRTTADDSFSTQVESGMCDIQLFSANNMVIVVVIG